MNTEHLYEKIRRRAPKTFNLEATQERVQAYNAAMIADWRNRFPDANSAILEVKVHASGHSRRRLNRYREFGSVRGGIPGLLVIREPTSFNEILDLKIIEIIAAAARAEVSEVEWGLLTVSEALTATP